MIKKCEGSSFDLQDKFSLSLVHHETKLNLIPFPTQNIKEWIGNDDTALNILQPLKVLNGLCIAYLLQDYPKEVGLLLGKKGINSQSSNIM